MRTRAALAAILLIFAGCLVACGDDDDDTTTPTGPGGSDEEYLRAICTNTREFSDALITKTSAEQIGEVVQDFIDAMKEVDPPADLREYNKEFVQYLEDALSDPTSLVTRQPPLPPDDIQRRLAAKEDSVDECKDGTFFSRDLSE